MNLLRYTVRRVLLFLPVLIGIVIITFAISHMIPGDPILAFLKREDFRNPQLEEALRRRWGLDRPLPEQLLIYVTNLFRGQMGYSIFSQRDVVVDLIQYWPATAELSTAALMISLVVGIPIGIISAAKRNKLIDHLGRVFALSGVSIPVFWLGLLLLFVFFYWLGWLPGSGRLDTYLIPPPRVTGFYTIDSVIAGNVLDLISSLRHLLLPAFVLSFESAALIMRVTRSSMLEALSQDYVRTARAGGIPELRIVFGHVLRNALIPTVTVIGLAFGDLLAGAILTETIFSWPGLGRYTVAAAGFLDYNAVLGVTVILALTYSIINLIVDLSYSMIDPRIRLEST